MQYNLVDKEINKKCKKAKEGWLEEKCQEVERLNLNPNFKENFQEDTRNCWQEIDASLEMYQRQERKTLLEEQQIAARWKECIKEIILETAETGPPILRSEVE